jgi:hypothetical protein
MEKIIKQILEKENISYIKLERATSGFKMLNYFIDDKYVLKISIDKETTIKLKKEIESFKLTSHTTSFNNYNTPKYITSGNFESFEYLIITKVACNSLYSTSRYIF